MNTNESIHTFAPEDIVVLGVASVETQGGGLQPGEQFGDMIGEGIADE